MGHSYVVSLAEAGLSDAWTIGRKAAVLGAMTAAGMPVPAGFGVVWSAVSAPPEDLRAAVGDALEALGDGPVAVRSSGVDEDTEGKSYAGQYDSILNVVGLDNVLSAIAECWSSGSSDRVHSYRNGDTTELSVGVLVQRMVPADSAGVAFGVNPVTGDDETVISAVTGLGESLMSGQAVADEWSVKDGVAVRSSGSTDAVAADQVVAVAALCSRVGEYFGAPQDIEWAIADDKLWLLQARPITATQAPRDEQPIDIVIPPGFSVPEGRSTRPWTPMQRSLYLPVFDRFAHKVFEYTTGIHTSVTTIGGWVYLTTPPDTMPALIERLERTARRLDRDEPLEMVERWFSEWKSGLEKRLSSARSLDLVDLSDQQLIDAAHELQRLFDDLHHIYFTLTGACIAINGELGLVAKRLLDWTPAQVLSLRGGLDGDHMAAAVALADLARYAARVPAVRDALEAGIRSASSRMDEIDHGFAVMFEDFCREYGRRSVSFDLTEPTLAETPTTFLALILSQIDTPFDLHRERAALEKRLTRAKAEAQEGIADCDVADRAMFAEALRQSDISGPVRDEKVYIAVGVWAQMRSVVIELGRRLARASVIDKESDVFFLEFEDGLDALISSEDRRSNVSTARAQDNWARSHPGPDHYGTSPEPMVLQPSTTPPSDAAARVMDVAMWAMTLWANNDQVKGGAPGSIRGVAASAGRYTGPARIVLDSSQFHKVRAGDVLVCPETTAQWSVLFPSLGALVADNGSLLSHPAIIAREYGVPAVVAASGATTTFADGELLEVDGTAGTVRLAPAAQHRHYTREGES